MLIDFTVKNYKTFNGRVDLSLNSYQGERIIKTKPNKYRLMSTIGHQFQAIMPLKSVFVYGAAGSGKTTLLESLFLMKQIVLISRTEQPEFIKANTVQTGIDVSSGFDISFMVDGILYEYGFETTYGEITEEWLYTRTRLQKESSMVFFRQHDDVEFGKHIDMPNKKMDTKSLVVSKYWGDEDEDDWYELVISQPSSMVWACQYSFVSG